MTNVVAVIPARSGSKGVPDKNVKLLAGKPLLAYSIAAAQLTNSIDRVIVSTDSENYANIARKYGAEVPFLRPSEISGDNSGDYEWARHLLDWMAENEGHIPRYLVHLRPTTPLRKPTYIEEAIIRIRHDVKATALRSIQEMSETAYKSFEIEKRYLKCICSGSFDIEAANRARQAYRKTYQANGYVDIIKTAYVIESNKMHGDRVIAFITPRVVEVDTVDDFDYLEYLAAKEPIIVNRLFKLKKSKT